ncbi:high affinity cGMP-specific 3',5'-cyclic phosphodiesterase 9A-like isoform X2 [Nelusetta ayraudi]|uniref:high affinity cGMP-specific 3',5'-cyclic phosphodiesterase 9A-like isoform X2 n=1 Tax=Nelusetta ayraudi TaxID=303726 RepID=UPI003F6EA9BA
MTTKIIHFTVNGRLEQAEFGAECSAADVKDLFRAAAEAGPHHILKLYNTNGGVVNISPQLEANTRDSHYRLEVVASDLKGVGMPSEIDKMECRLSHLESKVIEGVGKTPDIICDLHSQVESFKKKLESVAHLSWMGLFREDADQHLAKFSPKPGAPQLSMEEEHQLVHTKFLNMSSLQVTEEVRELLKSPIFDNWQWEEAEMLVLLQVMFTDLEFLTALHIELAILQNFLFEMYGLIWLTELRSKLSSADLLIMLTSALCHDLDHPGYNNVYQINAQTDLALRYNDISPLENHHCAMAFRILSKPECNILKNLTVDQYKHIRGGMIKCILATDMARHNEILNRFKVIQPVFDFGNKEHKEVLMKIMVKVSDISNEARPMAVAEPWLDCLLQEFFNQSDTEKLQGLPVTPFMDRDKVSKPSSQTNFIRFVLLPLFSELTKLFPCLEQHILEPVRHALEYYSELERASRDTGGVDEP